MLLYIHKSVVIDAASSVVTGLNEVRVCPVLSLEGLLIEYHAGKGGQKVTGLFLYVTR